MFVELRHRTRFHTFRNHHSLDAVGRVLGWHWSAAELDPKLLTSFPCAGGLRRPLLWHENPKQPLQP